MLIKAVSSFLKKKKKKTLALGRQRQGDLSELQANQSYTVRYCLKPKQNKTTTK